MNVVDSVNVAGMVREGNQLEYADRFRDLDMLVFNTLFDCHSHSLGIYTSLSMDHHFLLASKRQPMCTFARALGVLARVLSPTSQDSAIILTKFSFCNFMFFPPRSVFLVSYAQPWLDSATSLEPIVTFCASIAVQ